MHAKLQFFTYFQQNNAENAWKSQLITRHFEDDKLRGADERNQIYFMLEQQEVIRESDFNHLKKLRTLKFIQIS